MPAFQSVAASRLLSACRQTGGNLVYQYVFRPRCFRLAPLAENAIHQESPVVGCPPYVTVRWSLVHLTLMFSEGSFF
jgi:hypothetical protein